MKPEDRGIEASTEAGNGDGRRSCEIAPYGLPFGKDCVRSALRANGPCFLRDASLTEFDRMAHLDSFPRNTAIFVEGQAPRGIYVLCQGRVKLTTTNQNGKTFIVRVVQAGEILGLQSVVSGQPHDLTVETLQPCQLAFIHRIHFLCFMKENADVCLHVVRQLSSECQAAQRVIRSVGMSHSAFEKMARLLLEWSGERQAPDSPLRIRISITQEEIAQQIGTTRETVTRVLSEMKKRRIIKVSGSMLLVRSREVLERYC